MKKAYRNILSVLILSLAALIFTGCYEPSPLYGKWKDNKDEYINFINDGTFVAKLFDDEGNSLLLEGDWTTVDNVLVFSPKNQSQVTTEWDIRGSMLFLTWNDSSICERNLTLYHVSK